MSAVITGVVTNTITSIHNGAVSAGASIDDVVADDWDEPACSSCYGPCEATGLLATVGNLSMTLCKDRFCALLIVPFVLLL